MLNKCYVRTAECGDPGLIRSAIAFNTYDGNAGIPLPCSLNCLTGTGIARVLQSRLENGGQAVVGVHPDCAASVAVPQLPQAGIEV